jgi:aryl-phospho-beta-D-glucosidase BglC (GH1 family)
MSIPVAYQPLGPAMRPEMWMTAILGTNGSGDMFQFQGAYHADWNTTITPLLKKLQKGYSVSVKMFSYINSVTNIVLNLST